jgi:hypothetical protein
VKFSKEVEMETEGRQVEERKRTQSSEVTEETKTKTNEKDEEKSGGCCFIF